MAPAAPLPRLITSIPPGPRQNKRTLLVLGTVRGPCRARGHCPQVWRPAARAQSRATRPACGRDGDHREPHDPARGLAAALDLCAAGPPARAGPGPHADGAAGADAGRPACLLSAVEQWLCRAAADGARDRPRRPRRKREDVQEDRGGAAATGAARDRHDEGGAQALVLQGDPDAGRHPHPAVPRGEGRRRDADGRARSFPRPSGRRPPTRRRCCMPIKWCRGCSCNPSIVTSLAPCG